MLNTQSSEMTWQASTCTKKKLVLNKPVYTGMTILENSKILMYDFFYNHLKAKYGGKMSAGLHRHRQLDLGHTNRRCVQRHARILMAV